MSIIYYYAKNDNLPIFLKYGIRLSKNFDKEINIRGNKKPFLIGFLNPRDDIKKYNSETYTCLKLDLFNNHCKVIDYSSNEIFDEFIDFIPLEEYKFGTYKNPIVLIDTSIISDKISVYNKIMDVPILYDNSEDFFYEVQIRKMIDERPLKDVYTILKNNYIGGNYEKNTN